ncbi:MAG: hypothetical protein ETSY2_14515 [Candidatus Entotheonella gemina]|uniref:Uncharacterized protein n=1 Tax=Candidatus Entotheonella gemina TaxID=1429439 RepID=W4M9P2_9BACT|nr:MAG: hypothetical protein ETSY2_14515 [Candidatus Entotheonella gemina]
MTSLRVNTLSDAATVCQKEVGRAKSNGLANSRTEACFGMTWYVIGELIEGVDP